MQQHLTYHLSVCLAAAAVSSEVLQVPLQQCGINVTRHTPKSGSAMLGRSVTVGKSEMAACEVP